MKLFHEYSELITASPRQIAYLPPIGSSGGGTEMMFAEREEMKSFSINERLK